MPELSCTVRRTGDFESRTEEYEVSYAVREVRRGLRIKYQAARAYEINAALDAAVEEARSAIVEAHPDLKGPTDEALAKFSWRSIQSAKYGEGEPTTSALDL
jgi:2-oxo-4-hydroxy-4-carboxy--5-ureidoimidazoline (OHCU) decarboxylase